MRIIRSIREVFEVEAATQEEAIALIQSGQVAYSEELDDEFEVIPKTIFTAEQRAAVMTCVDLREYANNCICGDGLEIDRAQRDFREMSDSDVVFNGILNGITVDDEDWESDLRSRLSAVLPVEVIDQVIVEMKER